MIDLQKMAMNLIAKNPQILQNNPNAQAWAKIIESGDNAAGEQLANNILQSYGVSKEEALQVAMNKFFGGPR